jgi:hypothetical protein
MTAHFGNEFLSFCHRQFDGSQENLLLQQRDLRPLPVAGAIGPVNPAT